MWKFGMATVAFLLCVAGAGAQVVQGVHSEASPLQIGVGFTFVSFNELPATTLNNVGVNGSVVYYHDYVGVEAQVSDAFGSQGGKTSQMLFAGGGVRFSLADAEHPLRPWVHMLIGDAHVTPQTTYGSDSALGYKVGAGVDFTPRHGRIGFRVGADMFGANFFKTYQLSPEVSAGIVLHLGRE
jgi:opacity protein-like surface antigen